MNTLEASVCSQGFAQQSGYRGLQTASGRAYHTSTSRADQEVSRMSARAPRSANHLGHSPSRLGQGPDEVDTSALLPSASEIEGL